MIDSTDLLLGRHAVAAGFIQSAELEACLDAQASARRNGSPTPGLGRILIERGLLTESQVASLVQRALRDQTAVTCVEESSPGPPPAAAPMGAPAGASPPPHASAEQKTVLRDAPGTVPAGSPLGTVPGAATEATVAGFGGDPPPPPRAAATEVAPMTPEQQFGRYRLEAEIARGGMGIVYRAFDTQLRRRVALKVMLSADAPSEEARYRFRREGLLAARLHHPNIVPVYDVGETDGKLFYTMELVDGETLHTVLWRMKVIPPRAALKIARDAARALQYSHEQGLVHRDIKPANLLLTTGAHARETVVQRMRESTIQLEGGSTASFRVLISDFGLAKDVAGETMLTAAGKVLGTPMYMAPEQATGDLPRVGGWSDQYSLGAVLYHMLCGEPPFDETDVARLLAAVILKDPVPLRRRAPGLHPDLETVVARAMEKEPRRRYASAGELADDLDRYLSGEAIRARPAGLAYRTWRRAWRHKELVGGLGGAVLLLLLTIGYFTLWPRVTAWREARRAEAARQARSADARARLATAEAEIAAGRAREAETVARLLVRDFAACGARGEDVALPEAHDLLARAAAARGEAAGALLERYRAYRATLGAPGSERYLLKAVRELVEALRFEDALPLVRRLIRESPQAEIRAAAEHWEGRALEGLLDFSGALHHFTRALSGSGLPADLVAECLAHRDFCAGLANASPLAPDLTVAGDLDGDGTVELAAVRRGEAGKAGEIVVGRLGPGGFAPQASLPIEFPLRHGLVTRGVVGLPDAGHPTLVVAGGDLNARAGEIRLLRWTAGALTQLATAPLESDARAFAVADLDGDGRPELLAGTVAYERALRVYDWDEAGARLTLRTSIPVGGDIGTVEVADFDADGVPEIAVFAGEWQCYGVQVIAWDRAARRPARMVRTPLGLPSSVVRVERPGAAPSFVVGVSWERHMSYPLRRLLGEEAFAATYRPPGAYLLEPQPDLTFKITALAGAAWNEAGEGWCYLARMHEPAGDFLWTSLHPSVVAGAFGEAEERTLIRVFRVGSYERPVALFTPGRKYGDENLGSLISAADVDGDGLDEVLFHAENGAVWLDQRAGGGEAGAGGVGSAGMPSPRPSPAAAGEGDRAGAGGVGSANQPSPRPSPAAAGEGDRSGVTRTGAAGEGDRSVVTRTGAAGGPRRHELLGFAEAAERVGLTDEALSSYVEALERVESVAEVAESVCGRLRCLARLGRVGELARVAEEAADRFPGAEAAILTEGLGLADRARAWAEVERLAARLGRAAEAASAAREDGRRAAVRAGELRQMPQRVRLVGAGATPVDWLAVSPLTVAPGADGGWTLYVASDGSDRVLTPLANAAESWRLTARLSVLRHDWATGVRLGLGGVGGAEQSAVQPELACLLLNGRGETRFPIYSLDLISPAPGGERTSRLRERGEAWRNPVAVELSFIAHQERLAVEVREGVGEAAPGGAREAVTLRRAEVEARSPQGGTVYAGFSAQGGEPPGFWLVAAVTELELASASSRVRPISFRARSAADLLLLANGRWIGGRTEEARSLYDRALALAELDRTREEAARAAKLPSGWERSLPNDLDRWVGVDARVYRALLRAVQGDGAGAQEDLRAAWAQSEERVAELVRRYALPLVARPAEAGALRDFWRAVSGNPPMEKKGQWAHETLQGFGPVATSVLIEGFEIVTLRRLQVRAVAAGGAAQRAGLRPGDVLLRVGEAEPGTAEELREALDAAPAGQERLAVEAARQGHTLRLEVRLEAGGKLGVDVEPVEMQQFRLK